MNLSNLISIKNIKKKKRIGRGYGSCKGGHTVGRGQKGQKSRSGGTAKKERDYGKKKGFVPPNRKEPETVDVKKLEVFKDDSTVTSEALVEKGIIKKIPHDGVKILGNGDLDKKLTVTGMQVSEGAKKKIEDAGGNVVS